jgi:branched-chain amino acid transport system ATP-binding protein
MSDATLAGIDARPGAPKPDPILLVDDVRKRFGGLVAVDMDHLEVPRGVITALIGPNGAGKTTLFNVLTGFEQPDAGHWTLDGREVTGSAPHQIARLGMVRTFQLPKALRKMTVLDNMMLAVEGQRGERLAQSWAAWRWRSQEAESERRAREMLERFQLDHMAHDYAGTLSGGQRKLLEMARSLMVEPRLLLLDEPMAGVNPALVESLLHHVVGLPHAGTTVLFIEHDMDVVMGVSDWVVCMAEGSVIAEGPPASVRADPAVIDAYLGTRHRSVVADDAAAGPHPGGERPSPGDERG